MKQGMKIEQLAAELTRQVAAKRDFVADSRAFRMTDDARALQLAEGVAMPINAIAQGQLATRLDVPRGFYDRMAAKHPDLLSGMVNQLFQREPQKAMVRTLDGNVRAVLSDKYRPLDNFDLAEAVLPALFQFGASVESCAVTESRLYIKAIVPTMTVELPPPEGHHMGDGTHTFYTRRITAGLTISNSEVGAGSLAIQPGSFERTCTNYASFSDAEFRKVHLGGRKDVADGGVWEFLTDATKRLSDAAIWSQVRDITTAALDGTVFARLVEQMTAARADVIEADPVKVVEVFARRERMTDDERGGLLRHLATGGEMSRYGLQWAVTRLANDCPDYDRASELERLGGKVIELPRAEWAEILRKAA